MPKIYEKFVMHQVVRHETFNPTLQNTKLVLDLEEP